MAKIDINKTELVWPGKYNQDGTLKDVPRINLPFQVVETVNESRATREGKKRPKQPLLFDFYDGEEGNTFEEGWKNKLIWGDNLSVMGSLLQKFAGKIDLIYIDPPFATGSDFSFKAPIGESGEEAFKEQSAIEEVAYRDTWGQGRNSWFEMIFDRLRLMRELLSDSGTLYMHLDWYVGHHIRPVIDEVFGEDNSLGEVIWAYGSPSGGRVSGSKLVKAHDIIFIFAKNYGLHKYQTFYLPYSEKYIKDWFKHSDEKGRYQKRQRIDKTTGARYWEKQYLEDSKGVPASTVWSDIRQVYADPRAYRLGTLSEITGYDTQKPEKLLNRIISISSDPGDLIADFFCGSGTTLAVAEKLGRRWIGCDLGRWGIHVTRKRLLDIENCKPFEVLNLGRYERQHWQGVTFADKGEKSITEQALYEYLAFILKIYGAQPLQGQTHLHGKRGKAMVHIGAVDTPVTIDEIDQALNECALLEQSELHVLGWEWEMGLAGPNNDVHRGGLMHEVAKAKNIKLILLQIPREVMELPLPSEGNIHFFELAYLDVAIEKPKKLTVQVQLKDFVIPNASLIPDDISSKVKKWSDYIDYWAVDWDFQNDTFMHGWVAYRTRKNRTLPLISDPQIYREPSKYRILIKVVDIFGNDTSQAFDVEVD